MWRGWWAGWARPGSGGRRRRLSLTQTLPLPIPGCAVASSPSVVDDAFAAYGGRGGGVKEVVGEQCSPRQRWAAVVALLSLNPPPPHAASSPRRAAPSTTPMPPTAAGCVCVKEVVGEVGSPAARPAVGGGGGSACPKPYPSPRCAPASPRRKASSATTKPPPPLGSTAARCSRSSETPALKKGPLPGARGVLRNTRVRLTHTDVLTG